MRKLALVAAAAAAVAVPTSPASAEPSCRQLAAVTGSSVAYCTERRWEIVDHYVRICTDKDLDGTPESCKFVLIASIFS
ncbi:MAG TPA: hypothetical protein VNQ77_05300 [Frankiaceae bacterium]|nr:hypothetical protein [Frankiaceae bacterium]